jgi:hypothetical protein
MKTVIETFKEATQSRLNYPLSRGEYKLREGRYLVGRLVSDIDEVLRYYRGFNDGHSFDSLTVQDLPHAFRKFPLHLINDLAYNILPAIKALDVDGANKGKIEQHLSTAKPKLIQILEDAQELHDLLCAGGKRSYERQTLRIGFMFAKLVEKIVSIVDQARLLLPPDSSIGTANKVSVRGHLKPAA